MGVVVGAHATLILLGALVLSALGYGGVTEPSEIPIGATVAATAPFWIAAIGFTVLVVRRSGGSLRDDLGLSFSWIDLPVGIVAGVVTQWVVLPVVYRPVLRLIDRTPADLEEAARTLSETATGGGGATLFLLMATVAAPIAEEIMYRGALLRSVEHRGWGFAIVVTSVVFAALHLQALQFLGLFIIGAVCALGAAWSGRLGTAIVTHVAFNAATAIPLILDR